MNINQTKETLEKLGELVGKQIDIAEKKLEISGNLSKDSENEFLLKEFERIISEENKIRDRISGLENLILNP